MNLRRVPYLRDAPLAVRMAGLFALLIAAIAVFMIVFFPARMEGQARRSANQRAIAIAKVMATAAGPAIEFDDDVNGLRLLGWLVATPEAVYGVLRRSDGTVLAAWHGERAPTEALIPHAAPVGGGEPATDDLPEAVTRFRAAVLDVAAPVRGMGGSAGTLQAGFSLDFLIAEKVAARRTVALATTAVLAVGLLACFLLASILVKPIRAMTATARRIATGDAPPFLNLAGNGRDEVGQMTEALDSMLRQLAEANRKLVDASRQAGMAEVATGVLHNVGNVLNSVNVSVTLLGEQLRASQIPRVSKGADILQTVLKGGAGDDRLPHLVPFFASLAKHLEEERSVMQSELAGVGKSVEHMKQIVAIQNAHARPAGVYEIAEINSVIDEALTLDHDSLAHHRVIIESSVPPLPAARIDRHAILQILLNLVTNAKDALTSRENERKIMVSATHDEEAGIVQVSVADNGAGIAAENLNKVFAAGFTTKPKGHGYGLHSSALAAQRMGGSLAVNSDGDARGATFILTVPYKVIERNERWQR
jgi:signal transduction histidine kinase